MVVGTTYTQTIELGKTYNFVIKSAYQLFKTNESNGLIINVKTKANDLENEDILLPEKNPDTPSDIDDDKNENSPSTDTGLE